MTRIYIVTGFALGLSLASMARGDVTYSNSGQGDNQMQVVRMTVTPAGAPEPALRYRLMAQDIDLKSGNSAPFYYRAQLNLHQVLKSMREKFDDDKELSRWYGTGVEGTPIADLPLDKVREACRMLDPVYDNYLTMAFQQSGCDWQLGLEELRGPGIISFMLPEFQDSREIARMQAMRTRLAIAEHRYNDAIKTMQEQYRLGHDVATVPLLVCGLIGIAIDSVSNGTLIELIASPDSPNMYWALSQLPNPPIDLRPGVRFEMDFGLRMFPYIKDTETTQRSPQEWNRLFKKSLIDLKSGMDTASANSVQISKADDTLAGMAATGLGLLGYTHAKERLIAEGMDRERVEKMAVGQVIAIYTERNYHRFADDEEKLWYIPFPATAKANKAFERRLEAADMFGGGEEREVWPLMRWLMPAMLSVRNSELRLEREVAALRVIEALRMYAATHDGQLPNALADIDLVSVPLNPATGKPFVYRLEGTTAVLELPPSDQTIGGNRRYEIQIAAKK